MATVKMSLQKNDSKLKARLKERVKKQKVELSCPKCGKKLANLTIGSLGVGKSYQCKKRGKDKKLCNEITQIDTIALRDVISTIDKL
jgi:predicted RNA-binding Zn-ribbon protein involved in translation (DUF1610 family)